MRVGISLDTEYLFTVAQHLKSGTKLCSSLRLRLVEYHRDRQVLDVTS